MGYCSITGVAMSGEREGGYRKIKKGGVELTVLYPGYLSISWT